MAVTEQDVMAALATVIDPELHVSLVQAGMVKAVSVENGRVRAKIELTTPACPMKGKIQADAEAALKAVAGVTGLDIEWGAQVRAAPRGQNPMLPQVKHVVLVGAGKGGVGKSTVAVNLAAALAQCGATVGLLDADFYGPSIPLMTGLSDKKPVSPDGQHLEPLLTMGLKVMSLGFLVEPDQALIWRGPMLHGALQQLMRDVNWGALDYLVVDLPPGTGDVALTISQSIRSSGAVLVTTPQDVALADVVRAKQMFDKVHIPGAGNRREHEQLRLPALPQGHAHFSPRRRPARSGDVWHRLPGGNSARALGARGRRRWAPGGGVQPGECRGTSLRGHGEKHCRTGVRRDCPRTGGGGRKLSPVGLLD